MTRSNVVINAFAESKVQLKALAKEEKSTMREVLERALKVYAAQGVEECKVTIVIEADLRKGLASVTSVAVKEYKPWLGREDASDIKMLPQDEEDEHSDAGDSE